MVSGTTEIDLSWNAVTDAGSGLAFYEVWDGSSLFATSSVTSYRCGGLGALAGHEFYVAAVDVAGNRTLSASPALTPASVKSGAKRVTVASKPNRLSLAFDDQSPTVVGTPLANPPAAPTGYTPIPGTAFDYVSSGGGAQTVVINYNAALLQSGTRVVMMHYTGGAWVDVTAEWDKAGHRVSGSSTTFSPFELFEIPATSTPASSWESLVALTLAGVVIASAALRRREDSLEPVPSRESQT